jgi:hypothetical protein
MCRLRGKITSYNIENSSDRRSWPFFSITQKRAVQRLLQIPLKFLSRLWRSFFMFLVLIPNINLELPGNFGFPDCNLSFAWPPEALLFMYSADRVWTVTEEPIVLERYLKKYMVKFQTFQRFKKTRYSLLIFIFVQILKQVQSLCM